MSQGTDLANHAAFTDAEPEQVWFVAVTGDDVKQMTLDQVADAFDAGVITSQTAVWTEGMDEWAPLGDVADLGDEPEQAVEAGQVAVAAAPLQEAAPIHVAAQPEQFVQPAMHSSVQPSIASEAATAPTPFVQSTVPVALSVEDDEPVAPKRARPVGKWLLAVAGVAALGVTIANTDLLGGSKKQTAKVTVKAAKTLASRAYEAEPAKELAKAEAVEQKVKQEAEPAGEAPIGTATSEEADPSEGSAAKKSLRDGLSGSAKKANKKKAKKRRSKRRSKTRSARRRKSSRKRSSKKKSVARTKSAFDPLNGSLP